MSASQRRRRYARLLRWYPRSWRQEHGSIMLDTLEQHASDRGVARPSIAESWSLRSHGLSERASYRWAAGFATTALIAFVVSIGVLAVFDVTDGTDIVRLVVSVIIGPIALILSAVVLLHRAGKLSAPAAFSTAASAIPACGFAALAAASWAVGFDEADAGVGQSWFAAATPLFLLLAWIAGTACLAAPVSAMVGKRRSRPIRILKIMVLAAILAFVVGALILLGQVIGVFAALPLLVVALRLGSAKQPAAPRDNTQEAVRSSPSGVTEDWTRQKIAGAGAAALATLVVGLVCVLFALTGSSWGTTVTDSDLAMNLGLAAGAMAAIPVTIAAGMVLAPRFGSVIRWSVLLCCSSLLVEAASQLLAYDDALQERLMLVAALLLGFAVALPFGRLVPGGRWLRIGVTAAFGCTGSIVGFLAVAMAGFIAPLAAAVFIWSLTRKPRRGTCRTLN